MSRRGQRLGQLTRPLRVAVADDHSIVRMGYRRLLALDPVLQVVAEYANAEEVLAGLTRAQQPDLVDVLVLDLSMPGRSGVDLLADLVQALPDLVVVVVTMHDLPAMRQRCLRLGAEAFLSKAEEPGALVDTIRAIRLGHVLLGELPDSSREQPHHRLTPREFDVMQRLLAGHGLEDVAAQMLVSVKTVSNYQTLIRQKLGVNTSLELLQYAQRHGLLP